MTTTQDRLAAAARALAAAEEAVRSPAPPSTHPSAHPSSREAAHAWVDGLLDPTAEASPVRARAGRGRGRRSRPGWSASDASAVEHDATGFHTPDAHTPDAHTPDPEPNADSVARQIVLRQLTMGPRTRKQLEDKLRQRDCDDGVAARVLDRMTEVGLVDDRAYAEMLVRSQQAGRGLARRALAQELRQKGVGDELVAQALGSIDPESERARAEELAAKKLRAMAGLDPQVQSRRLSGMLARKGYSPGVVYAVVREAVNAAPEHQRD